MGILKAAFLTTALTLTLPNCNQENEPIEELEQLPDTEIAKSLDDHLTDAGKFSSIPDSLKPPYTLTMWQLNFLQEAGAPIWVGGIRELSIEDKWDIKEGRLTGNPLKDCLEAFYQYNNEVRFNYTEWKEDMSLKFKMSQEEVDMAYALGGLSIIDGAPTHLNFPNKEQLKELKESGLINKLDERWEMGEFF